MSPSFRRRVFAVNQLHSVHWYWQLNKNNRDTEHTNDTMQKVALVNRTTDTLNKSELRERRDRAWFSSFVWHPTRMEWVYFYNHRDYMGHLRVVSWHGSWGKRCVIVSLCHCELSIPSQRFVAGWRLTFLTFTYRGFTFIV